MLNNLDKINNPTKISKNYRKNQKIKNDHFIHNNNNSLSNIAKQYKNFNQTNNPHCKQLYKYNNGIQNTRETREVNNIINKGYINHILGKKNTQKQNPQHNQHNQHNQHTQNYSEFGYSYNLPSKNIPTDIENFQNFLNDPTNDEVLDVKSRPMTNFVHNNFVPFFGSSVKQSVAGTGVEQGNIIQTTDINKKHPENIKLIDSGFDESTPYSTKLNTFTGLDDNYLHKREIGAQFSPAETQTNFVNGVPLFRPTDDRYTVALNYRNDESPVEKQQVGPGIGIDPQIPAIGGYQQYVRVLPNNVNDYKANQLPGRVNVGKFVFSSKPESYPGVGVGIGDAPGVAKNRPNKFFDQIRYPTFTTRASSSIIGDEIRPSYTESFKPRNSNRQNSNYGFGYIKNI